MVSYHSHRKATKTEVGARRWVVAVTVMPTWVVLLLCCFEECLGLWTRTEVECPKQSLMGHFCAWKKNADSGEPARRIQMGTRTLLGTRLVSNYVDIHSAHVLRPCMKLDLKVMDWFLWWRRFQDRFQQQGQFCVVLWLLIITRSLIHISIMKKSKLCKEKYKRDSLRREGTPRSVIELKSSVQGDKNIKESITLIGIMETLG